MVDGSIHKVVAERGGGSTEANTAAAVVVAVPTALPIPSSSFYYSSH